MVHVLNMLALPCSLSIIRTMKSPFRRFRESIRLPPRSQAWHMLTTTRTSRLCLYQVH